MHKSPEKQNICFLEDIPRKCNYLVMATTGGINRKFGKHTAVRIAVRDVKGKVFLYRVEFILKIIILSKYPVGKWVRCY
jgi:hypothetical protein